MMSTTNHIMTVATALAVKVHVTRIYFTLYFYRFSVMKLRETIALVN